MPKRLSKVDTELYVVAKSKSRWILRSFRLGQALPLVHANYYDSSLCYYPLLVVMIANIPGSMIHLTAAETISTIRPGKLVRHEDLLGVLHKQHKGGLS